MQFLRKVIVVTKKCHYYATVTGTNNNTKTIRIKQANREIEQPQEAWDKVLSETGTSGWIRQ